MLPCERWNELEEAGHFAKFSLQGFDNPSADNRVDLITRNPYRLDLDTKTMVRLRYHPISQADLGPPLEILNGLWNPAKEELMIKRMLGKAEVPPQSGPTTAGNQEREEPRGGQRDPLWSEEEEQLLAHLSPLGAGALPPAPVPLALPPPGGLPPQAPIPGQRRTLERPALLERLLLPVPNQGLEQPLNRSATRPPNRPGLGLDSAAARNKYERDLRNASMRLAEARIAHGESPHWAQPPVGPGYVLQTPQGPPGRRLASEQPVNQLVTPVRPLVRRLEPAGTGEGVPLLPTWRHPGTLLPGKML